MSIVVILDNIRSLYNVGSIFRTADAVGSINQIILCGITGTPATDPNKTRIAKTALSGIDATAWIYRRSSYRTVMNLKRRGYYIVSLERTANSQPIRRVAQRPLAIVVGHEVNGVDPKIVAASDEVLHIPMRGRGISLNVASAFAIGAYTILG